MFIFNPKIYHHSGIKNDDLGEYIHYLDHYVKQLKNAVIRNYNNVDMYKWLNDYRILNTVIDNVANIVYRIETIRINTCKNIINFSNDNFYEKVYKDNMKLEESPKIILDNKLFLEIIGNIMDCLIIVYSSPYMDDPDYVYSHDKTETIFGYLKRLDGYSYNNPPLREAINYIKKHYMDRLVAHINLNN